MELDWKAGSCDKRQSAQKWNPEGPWQTAEPITTKMKSYCRCNLQVWQRSEEAKTEKIDIVEKFKFSWSYRNGIGW